MLIATRRTLVPAFLLMLVVIAAALVRPGTAPAAAPIDAYRGAGVWVDVYDTAIWRSPAASLRTMHARGVRSLYLQTSNSSQPYAVYRPAATAAFIEGAHARGMRVVAWYLPTLTNPRRDLARSLAAIRFRTPRGQRFDSFGMDIESSAVRTVSTRNARLLALSRRVRAAVGPDYPLGAVTPSPVGMQLHPKFWPRFPYRQLRAHYDVFVPMVYTTYHVDGAAAAGEETAAAIEIFRAAVGEPAVPVHVIAGVADRLSAAEGAAVARAAVAGGAIGLSMYDMATMDGGDWSAVRAGPDGSPVPAP